jgi:hypothetical protein
VAGVCDNEEFSIPSLRRILLHREWSPWMRLRLLCVFPLFVHFADLGLVCGIHFRR